MSHTPQPLPRMLWAGMLLVFVLLILAYLLSFAELKLKPALPVLGQVADFALVNQDGQPVTLATLTNHVWVADIIFTRCAGPCPIMTGHMKALEDALGGGTPGARLVTLTTDPDFDTPAVLKKYGDHFGADFRRWTFLTGTKASIAGLAGGSLKLGSVPVDLKNQKNVADLFIHTTMFVLVDKHAQLRAFYETEGVDAQGQDIPWANVQERITTAVRRLELEP